MALTFSAHARGVGDLADSECGAVSDWAAGVYGVASCACIKAVGNTKTNETFRGKSEIRQRH